MKLYAIKNEKEGYLIRSIVGGYRTPQFSKDIHHAILFDFTKTARINCSTINNMILKARENLLYTSLQKDVIKLDFCYIVEIEIEKKEIGILVEK